MRVRISYTVDLDDVPLECARMLHDSIEKIEEAREEISDLIRMMTKPSYGLLKIKSTDVVQI